MIVNDLIRADQTPIEWLMTQRCHAAQLFTFASVRAWQSLGSCRSRLCLPNKQILQVSVMGISWRVGGDEVLCSQWRTNQLWAASWGRCPGASDSCRGPPTSSAPGFGSTEIFGKWFTGRAFLLSPRKELFTTYTVWWLRSNYLALEPRKRL